MRVLLVDDSKAMRIMVRKTLDQTGVADLASYEDFYNHLVAGQGI